MRRLPLTDAHPGGQSCVARVPIFAHLSGAEQDVVAALARPVQLARGEVLHHAGDAVGHLVVVHTGRLKLVHTAPSGRTHLVRVAEPGDVVGEHAFLTGARPDADAEALTDARACVFAHADLGRLLTTYPAIALGLLRNLSRRLDDAERRLSLSAVEVRARVASHLLDLPSERGAAAHRVRLPLTKKDTASYLATTPESFSRTLARLQRDGLIAVRGDVIDLLDAEGLEAVASGG